ncbi:hypothetical protein [Maricaulis salignorans]|uniref:Uncharacterized protein n=1 Tax=Maricaulis salignorans TaxID=144026 RepID=A0A1G9S0F8_9PROT|nr:hypothetical protein [Maricaulis salignorans]SDM28946.1 hypothetical protein SAMN04488568_10863 [Maricaulis salignorans]
MMNLMATLALMAQPALTDTSHAAVLDEPAAPAEDFGLTRHGGSSGAEAPAFNFQAEGRRSD